MTHVSVARSVLCQRLFASLTPFLDTLRERRRAAKELRALESVPNGLLHDVVPSSGATSMLNERDSRDAATRLQIEDLRRRML